MWWMPILTAMGINAGKNILTGKNPLDKTLEAGAIAGATGGLLGSNIPGAEIPVENATEFAKGTIESELGNINPVTGTYLAKDQYANVLGTPVYTGGQGLLSNIGSNISDVLGDITPQNLAGVASLLSQEQPSQYRQMAGTGGSVSKGNTGGLAVNFPQAKVFKKRGA